MNHSLSLLISWGPIFLRQHTHLFIAAPLSLSLFQASMIFPSNFFPPLLGPHNSYHLLCFCDFSFLSFFSLLSKGRGEISFFFRAVHGSSFYDMNIQIPCRRIYFLFIDSEGKGDSEKCIFISSHFLQMSSNKEKTK